MIETDASKTVAIGNVFQEFGTFTIGFFFSRQLMKFLKWFLVNFERCQFLATPGPLKYFAKKKVPSEVPWGF